MAEDCYTKPCQNMYDRKSMKKSHQYNDWKESQRQWTEPMIKQEDTDERTEYTHPAPPHIQHWMESSNWTESRPWKSSPHRSVSHEPEKRYERENSSE